MKTVLVLTDFSDCSLNALKVAVHITEKVKGKIKLVHVFNLSSSKFEEYTHFNKFYQEMKANAEDQLSKWVRFDFLKGSNIEKHLVTDISPWEILNDMKFKNADLIVMGSHGTSGINKNFYGSNAEKIVRLADIPVLTIKNEVKDFNINKMVFASTFCDESDKVFKKIRFFTDLYKAHIYLLKVITPKEFEPTPVSQGLLKRFIRKFNLQNCSISIYNSQNIESGIIEFSDEVKADLIAIETHGRTGLAHLINGSLAEDIVKHEPKPVLSIRIPTLSKSVSKHLGFNNNYENWGCE